MAYFVAKELHLRPMEILTEWTCEELLVAYGIYANVNSKQSYDMMDKKERAKKDLSWFDRWAMPFISKTDMLKDEKEINNQIDEMDKIREAIFG